MIYYMSLSLMAKLNNKEKMTATANDSEQPIEYERKRQHLKLRHNCTNAENKQIKQLKRQVYAVKQREVDELGRIPTHTYSKCGVEKKKHISM